MGLARHSPKDVGYPISGIHKFKPFEVILKDGFSQAACVKDQLFFHGDTFGDNQLNYTLESRAEDSIVHYEAHVPKEDRTAMTQNMCCECFLQGKLVDHEDKQSVVEQAGVGLMPIRCYTKPFWYWPSSLPSEAVNKTVVVQTDYCPLDFLLSPEVLVTLVHAGNTEVFEAGLCEVMAEQGFHDAS